MTKPKWRRGRGGKHIDRDQQVIPSQLLPDRKAYAPLKQADIEQQDQWDGPDGWGVPNVEPYVLSSFDARPINAIDFIASTGSNAADTFGAGIALASTFYTVPPGRVAIVRDWDVVCNPQAASGGAVLDGNGSSRFFARLSFFINGIVQDQMSSVVLGSLPFGSVFNQTYLVANENDVIEMRLSGLSQANPLNLDATTTFFQVLSTFHGNLLLSKGLQANTEPGAKVSLPVRGRTSRGGRGGR